VSASYTIALDAMGGDDAPSIVVKGADLARRRFPDVRFRMFGDEARILPLMKRRKRLSEITEIIHKDDVIGSDMTVSVAIRKGRKSSMQL
ncbi:unnamed protein product, partial [Laminaria digitata]